MGGEGGGGKVEGGLSSDSCTGSPFFVGWSSVRSRVSVRSLIFFFFFCNIYKMGYGSLYTLFSK